MPRRPVVSRTLVITKCTLLCVNKATRVQVEVQDKFAGMYYDSESLLKKARKKYADSGLAVADVVDYHSYRAKTHMEIDDYVNACTVDSESKAK